MLLVETEFGYNFHFEKEIINAILSTHKMPVRYVRDTFVIG